VLEAIGRLAVLRGSAVAGSDRRRCRIRAGSLLAHQIGRSIFNSQISIEPVLFPIILAIAVFVTFAGSAAAISAAVKFDPAFAFARGSMSASSTMRTPQQVAERRANKRTPQCSSGC